MQLGEQASALVRVTESSFTDQLTIKNDNVSLKLAHSCKRTFGNFYQQVSKVSKKLADLFGGLSTTFLGVPVGKMGFKWPEDGGRA